MHRSLVFIFLLLSVGWLTGTTWGQDTTTDSLSKAVAPDSNFMAETSIWPVLVRSTIIPGWGQIEQEHPGRAVVFYGLSVYLLYHLAWNYAQYEKTNVTVYRQHATHYAILYAQVFTLNILDVVHEHVFHRDQPWPGQLFSDLPVKSPWGAVARSAMLPGWGQLYNRKYIKSVIALGICFDFGRKVYVYNQRYQSTGRKYYLERRVVNSWYLGLFYMLNMVDAYVDAYLYKFDEIMELSIEYAPPYNTPLIGVYFEF